MKQEADMVGTPQQRIINSMLLVAGLTFFSKVLGYVRDAFSAAYVGVGGLGDAYYLANTIPLTLFDVGMACLYTSFVPLFIDARMNSGRERANRFASSVINLYAFMTLALILVGIAFAPWIVGIFAPGMQLSDRNTAAHLTQIAFPVLFFRALVSIFTGILQTEKRFLSSCLEGIFLSITTIIACVFAYKWLKADALMLAFVLAYVLYDITLIFLLKGKFSYRMSINWNDEYVKKMLFMSWPVILGALAKEMSLIVDRMMASSLDKGTIAALYYSDRINGIFLGIFVASVGLVLYPEFSEASVKGDMVKLRKSLNSALTVIMLFCIPVTIFILIMGKDLVSLLFERGDFDRAATSMTAYILSYFIFLMLPQGMREILSRVYYS